MQLMIRESMAEKVLEATTSSEPQASVVATAIRLGPTAAQLLLVRFAVASEIIEACSGLPASMKAHGRNAGTN